MKLRNYATENRAQVYARQLSKRYPKATFEVRLSPLQSYAFRYLILCTKSTHGEVISGAWVSK